MQYGQAPPIVGGISIALRYT